MQFMAIPFKLVRQKRASLICGIDLQEKQGSGLPGTISKRTLVVSPLIKC